MRFRVGDKEFDRPCFWEEDGSLILIDQRRLPAQAAIIRAGTVPEQVEAIRTLAVRGAPAIGAFGAYSLALALSRGEEAYGELLRSRPTAVDLRNCMDMVMEEYANGGKEAALLEARRICGDIIERCRRIGEHGIDVIKDGARVMTHCNAGALATLDHGTALAPVRTKVREGGRIFVWVSETRPLLQGARLTAWELQQEGIEHSIIIDSACGSMMRKGEVDLVITGADRVCTNGDIANKIGTYDKAVLAKENDIPFYVAFPSTTIDMNCSLGDDIPIEYRGEDEVKEFGGAVTSPEGSPAFNPAFDVTPAEYITGYITEEGIFDLDGFIGKIKKKPRPLE
ncbi:MAG: S-methyl-5-thioribose-1-phosphate isomerase [Thermoplasmatota archaeon]